MSMGWNNALHSTKLMPWHNSCKNYNNVWQWHCKKMVNMVVLPIMWICKHSQVDTQKTQKKVLVWGNRNTRMNSGGGGGKKNKQASKSSKVDDKNEDNKATNSQKRHLY